MKAKWLEWATEIQSIAQAGLTFSESHYDIDRYKKLRNIAVQIVNEYTDVPYEKLLTLFAGETGYQTPKVDIRSAVFRGDSILMAKEKIDGRWSLPGGWADVNSSVSESAIRECYEEAGAVVKAKRIIAIQTANRQNDFIYPYTIYKIFMQCELIEWKFKENMETYGADFFTLENLPELSVERNNRKQIEMCFAAKDHDVMETIFD